jgi:agmatinase
MKKMNSFAGFPHCKDIFKLHADIAIIGIPYGSPYDKQQSPHSLMAPAAIRRESNRNAEDPHAWDFDLGDTLHNICGGRIVDCGDLPGSQREPERNTQIAEETIRQILKVNSLPVVLGGDDSIPIPVLHAYAGQEPFYVLQLDAHIDWRDEVNDVNDGFSSTMRRASEMSWVKGIVQVGMRGVGSARKTERQAALDYGAKLITSKQYHLDGPKYVLDQIPSASRCFITMDFDVLDPSIMPAVGAPTPGGLFYQETIDLIHAVSKRTQIIGVCLVELVPELDLNDLGAITAMRIVWNTLGAMCLNIEK